MNRRRACQRLGIGAASLLSLRGTSSGEKDDFKLRYILSSAMYGEMPLEAILPEVTKTGCEAIDIWCKVHGNQREQIDALGHEAALALFQKHQVTPAVFTRSGK